ncbi:hypothetical protein E0765_11785 [Sulfuricurvum sp. IAE1]|uniref:hypothetical protein n=1 Tax=Sulfuricurvum sp. IAE1 TaxID=2546102 RepID=UPI0010476874|nr:hypothetical protein [Sulfuricurvum sp. IAE1]TDA62485.1 hypothetical protein E0765_11785 [Sulfuricurvum sp. IAE1]
MDQWTKNQLESIIDSSLTSLRDAYLYSDIWTSFFEVQDLNEKFEIEPLFQNFIRHAIHSIVLAEFGEDDPCNELDWDNRTNESILLPIECFMKNLSCLESPFSEDIPNMECQSDCEDYFYEYMAFIGDSECFKKLVEYIYETVIARNPSKMLFEKKVGEWKLSTI